MANGKLYRTDILRSASDQIWFRYQQDDAAVVKIEIYTVGGALIRTISGLGERPGGEYASRSRAVFWDRTEDDTSRVSTGIYFVWLYLDTVFKDLRKFELL